MPSHEVPLHGLAEQALALVKVQDAGRDSAIAPGPFAALKKRLGGHRHDTLLFIHLCVVSARLRRQGLLQAAEQFHALAAIGLQKHELVQAVERADKLRDASQALKAPVRRSAVEGLPAGRNLGISLRGGRRQSTGPQAPKKLP